MVLERRKPIRDLLMPKTTNMRPSSIFDTSFTYDQAMKEDNNPEQPSYQPESKSIPPLPPTKREGPSMKESKSFACIPCSKAHISAIAGALNEAIRPARDNGITDLEVIDRLGIATSELAAMERIDLAPYKIARLKGEEKEFATWIVTKTRDLRHSLDGINNVEKLEQAAKEATDFQDEFLPQFWKLLEKVSKK